MAAPYILPKSQIQSGKQAYRLAFGFCQPAWLWLIKYQSLTWFEALCYDNRQTFHGTAMDVLFSRKKGE